MKQSLRLSGSRSRVLRFVLAVAAAGGACERVGYYSITGSDGGGDDTSGGPPGATSTGTGTGPTDVTRGMVLENVVTCTTSLYGEVAAAGVVLESATAALKSSPSQANEAAAREAWEDAIGLWQQAEIIKLGTAGPTALPEGLAMRDYVYSWPLVSRCLVEQSVVSGNYASPTFPSTALINTRGLAAMEYLLFYEGEDNACSATSSINAQGTWAALTPLELSTRKSAYAAVLGSDVRAKLDRIRADFSGSDGFGAGLAASGGAGGVFETDQAALNAVSDGLFYLEHEVKDLKLGKPLGKTADCPNASCPEAVESLYAHVDRDHVRNNLIGFRRVFDGCDGALDAGFDDLLRSAGAGDLADRMTADLEAAIAAADALPSSDFGALLATDTASLEALHAAVKKVTDALKTEFVTVLDLEPPVTVEGDND